MRKAGVTGYSGFIGKRLMAYPKLRFQAVPLQLRGAKPGELDCGGLDVIIHLAGKAHDMNNPDPQEYFDVNTELTTALAVSAKAQGVAHFIYVSSVKVYGDGAEGYYNEVSACHPDDPYGESKYKAEQMVRKLASPGFSVAVIRPPLVYGPEVKANMFNLMKLAHRNIPLPFGDTDNRRSMVFVDNLVELVNTIIDNKASGVFIAGDKEPLSTAQWVSLIRKQMGKKPALFRFPFFAKSFLQRYKPRLYRRLYGSFVIDNTGTNMALGFHPPYSSEEGIGEMVRWYLKTDKD